MLEGEHFLSILEEHLLLAGEHFLSVLEEKEDEQEEWGEGGSHFLKGSSKQEEAEGDTT